MKKQTTEINGMINGVTINATYKSSRRVPRIGQRKKFSQGGETVSLVLHDLKVNRRGVYDEDARLIFEFSTEEYWTGYYEF